MGMTFLSVDEQGSGIYGSNGRRNSGSTRTGEVERKAWPHVMLWDLDRVRVSAGWATKWGLLAKMVPHTRRAQVLLTKESISLTWPCFFRMCWANPLADLKALEQVVRVKQLMLSREAATMSSIKGVGVLTPMGSSDVVKYKLTMAFHSD